MARERVDPSTCIFPLSLDLGLQDPREFGLEILSPMKATLLDQVQDLGDASPGAGTRVIPEKETAMPPTRAQRRPRP